MVEREPTWANVTPPVDALRRDSQISGWPVTGFAAALHYQGAEGGERLGSDRAPSGALLSGSRPHPLSCCRPDVGRSRLISTPATMLQRSLLFFLSVALAAGVSAQDLPGLGSQPQSGFFALQGGFSPDPATMDVTPIGYQAIPRSQPDCNGFVGAQSDAVLNYTVSSYSDLTFSAAAAGPSLGSVDLMIAVRDPYGNYYCDDDSAGNSNPMVDAPAVTGQYTIWVGDFGQNNQYHDAVLGVSERGSAVQAAAWNQGTPAPTANPMPVRPSSASTGEVLGWNAQPWEGTLTLANGFSPDPQAVAVRPGGDIAASAYLPNCVGYLSNEPDLEVEYTASASYPQLTFSAASGTDIALIVRDPNGSYHCDDDGAGGTNPMVQVSSPASGSYKIWATVYAPLAPGQAYPEGILGVSETSTLVTLAAPVRPSRRPATVIAAPGTRQAGGRPAVRPPVRPASPSDGRASGVLSNWAGTPYSGTTTLRPGYRFDPRAIDVDAGGPVSNPLRGAGCAGFLGQSPDVVVNYTHGAQARNLSALTFSALAPGGEDLSLVVRTPSGIYYCDDDTNGTNPQVNLSQQELGEYRVWVGTYAQSRNDVTAYLGVSETGTALR